MNNVVLIGKVIRLGKLAMTANDSKVLNITLEVERPFKSPEGNPIYDHIDCVVWRGLAENAASYCSENQLIAVKGRIQARTYEAGEKQYTKINEVIIERIKYLSFSD